MNADWGCYWHLEGRGPGVPLTLPPCQAEGDATRGSRQLLGRVGDSDLVERDLAGVQNVAFGEKTQLGTRTWGPGLFLHPLDPGGSVASAGGGRGGLFFSRFFFFFHLKNISLLVTCARYLASQGAERLRSPRGAKPEPRPCFQGRRPPWASKGTGPERISTGVSSPCVPRCPLACLGAGLQLPTRGLTIPAS